MRWLIIIAVFAISAIGAHLVTLKTVPGAIMQHAMDTMSERGLPLHSFALAPRITPQTQTVVRPSPDLAYSICLFDFADGVEGLDISASPWPGYGSVSLFDANTVNFATFSARGDGSIAAIRLVAPGAQTSSPPLGVEIVEAPTRRGIVLVRRLAPRATDYVGAAIVSAGDVCAPVTD